MVFNNPIYFVDVHGFFSGSVRNNSSKTVYILTGHDGPQGQGHYEPLEPGETTPFFDDVDGVWSDGKFYAVDGIKRLTIGCDGPTKGEQPWNGNPKSKDGKTNPNSPRGRGAPNNAPPQPTPYIPYNSNTSVNKFTVSTSY